MRIEFFFTNAIFKSLQSLLKKQKQGLENLRIENDVLKQENETLKKRFVQEKKELEKKLVYATTVLNEVSSMTTIKGLAEMEEAIGRWIYHLLNIDKKNDKQMVFRL